MARTNMYAILCFISVVYSQNNFQVVEPEYFYENKNTDLFIAKDSALFIHFSKSRHLKTSVPFISKKILNGRNNKNLLRLVYNVYIDDLAPKTRIKLSSKHSYRKGNTIFYDSSLKFDFHSKDNSSGIFKIYASINNNKFLNTESLEPVKWKEDKNLISYFSIDNVGNKEPVNHYYFTIDYSAPKTSISYIGKFDGEFCSNDTKIQLSSVDNLSGLKKIFYKINNGEYGEYKDKILTAKLKNGYHRLYYYSIDHLNNKENEQSFRFYHDAAGPNTTLNIKGLHLQKDDIIFISKNSKLNLSVNDGESGPGKRFYKINSDKFRLYTDTLKLQLKNGFNEFQFYSLDKVENKESIHRRKLYLDLSPPQSSHSISGKVYQNNDTLIIAKSSVLQFEANDFESGLQGVFYSINEKDEAEYKENVTFDEYGFYRLKYYAKDLMGNSEKIKKVYIYVREFKNKAAEQKNISIEKQWILSSDKTVTGSTKEKFYLTISSDKKQKEDLYLLDFNLDANTLKNFEFKKAGKKVLTVEVGGIRKSYSVDVDSKPPVSNSLFKSSATYSKNRMTFYKNDLTVFLSAIDSKFGIQSGNNNIYYSVDESDFLVYKRSIQSFHIEKSYKLKYFATDSVGNKEPLKTKLFWIDNTSPKTRIHIKGPILGRSISTKSKIVLKSKDFLSGVKNIYYKIDKSAEKKYISAISVNELKKLSEGQHDIRFFAIDNLGNKEKIKRYTFNLFYSKPIVSIEVAGNFFIKSGMFFLSGKSQFKLFAKTNGAPVKKIVYSFDKKNFQIYKASINPTFKHGLGKIYYYASDIVSNISNVSQQSFFIDLESPKTSKQIIGPYYEASGQKYFSSETKIILNANDGDSGLKNIFYKVNLGSVKTYKGALSFKKQGLQKLYYFSEDNVYNKEKANSFHFVIDNLPPEISIVFSKEAYKKKNIYHIPENSMIHLGASDNLTGLERILYSINNGPKELYEKPIHLSNSDRVIDLKVTAFDQVKNRSFKDVMINLIRKKK